MFDEILKREHPRRVREPDVFKKHCRAAAGLLAVALCVSGCAALEEARLRRQERIKQQQSKRYLTFARPDGQISVSPDGLEIGSVHYTLTFHENLLKNAAFDEAKERQEFGRGALVYMESLYTFIQELFGIDPPVQRIGIVLYEKYQGTTRVAITETNYSVIPRGNAVSRTVGRITMHFPIAMFDQRDVRAHELTHAFTTVYYFPIWFTEGIAVFVQNVYAKGAGHLRIDLQEGMKLDTNNVNAIQTWKGHGSDDAQWGYSYSYSIAKTLYDRFGEDFYPELFRVIKQDELHRKLPRQMDSSLLIYYLSQAAGEDLVPFFQELNFNVRQLTGS